MATIKEVTDHSELIDQFETRFKRIIKHKLEIIKTKPVYHVFLDKPAHSNGAGNVLFTWLWHNQGDCVWSSYQRLGHFFFEDCELALSFYLAFSTDTFSNVDPYDFTLYQQQI
jgi:hypothetical protein